VDWVEEGGGRGVASGRRRISMIFE